MIIVGITHCLDYHYIVYLSILVNILIVNLVNHGDIVLLNIDQGQEKVGQLCQNELQQGIPMG